MSDIENNFESNYFTERIKGIIESDENYQFFLDKRIDLRINEYREQIMPLEMYDKIPSKRLKAEIREKFIKRE